MSDDRVDQLLEIVEMAYSKKSWHGPNLRGSIRGVSEETAAWRPSPERHNIWEIVVHTAYWKYTVRRRIRGEKRGSFPLKGSDWFPRPDRARTWAEDIALLAEVHASLRAVIAELSSTQLDTKPDNGQVTVFQLISGIAAHDVYHAGQIQLLKRIALSHGGA